MPAEEGDVAEGDPQADVAEEITKVVEMEATKVTGVTFGVTSEEAVVAGAVAAMVQDCLLDHKDLQTAIQAYSCGPFFSVVCEAELISLSVKTKLFPDQIRRSRPRRTRG